MMTAQDTKNGGELMRELEILQQAGLTVYQSKAYLVLKSESDLTPSQVAYRSGVPQSKVYETLYSLERVGLVKRYPNKEIAATVDKKINRFMTEMKSHHVTVRVFGRGRIKQVWKTNGVSLTSLVDRSIRQLEKTKRKVARYEAAVIS
jgi:predicted transcriptional regulator